MVKEAKNVDFYTTGREPSEQGFKRISEWILQNKEKQNKVKQLATDKQSLLKH
jgi:hypothetical protein